MIKVFLKKFYAVVTLIPLLMKHYFKAKVENK